MKPLQQPAITIAMPFYNRAATLEKTIRSLLNQTWTDFELLLVDDGSTDNSVEVAKSFQDPRIVVRSDGMRKRLPARLNECIDVARGNLFARMDSDDIAYPSRLERQAEFLQRHRDVDLCGTAALIIGNDDRPLWKFNPQCQHSGITRDPYRGFPILHPTWMGRIEWFRTWRYDDDSHLGQDQEILFRAFKHSTYANLPEPLLGFRQDTILLKKLFRLKIQWIRQVRRSSNGPDTPLQLGLLVGTQVARLGANCLAKMLGTSASLARQNGAPVSPRELEEWESVCPSAKLDAIEPEGNLLQARRTH